MQPAIHLQSITKTFHDASGKELTALDRVSIDIQSGEFFLFVGPSGCGKSTILRIMSGLDKDYHGKLVYDSSIDPSKFSFVFQHFALLPWLTVAQNVETGLIGRHMPPDERKSTVQAELKLLGLDRFAKSYPHQLSGGMQQRVGIARALATKPSVMFMDEPFSELDSFTAEELRKELLQVWEERKMTIIMVTHIVEEALELGDRIAVMTPRPGKIEQIVENRLPRPRSLRSKEFFEMEDTLYALIRNQK